MENVHKTRNFGALARTCDATGIGVIHAITADPSTVKLGHKTAGGTEKWLSVYQHLTVEAAYAEFHKQGYRIFAAAIGTDTIDFRDVDYSKPTAIVVGSELDGLSDSAAANADECIHVPLMGMVESLNVSVATGIILYEAARQREKLGMYARRRIATEEYDRLLFEWLHPRVASYCQQRGRSYPRLDCEGEIRESITGNAREGLK
jgi:tRNA (guanosine-2'-O-)-methyltransferase